jgi:hypothetical protein
MALEMCWLSIITTFLYFVSGFRYFADFIELGSVTAWRGEAFGEDGCRPMMAGAPLC